MAFRGNVVEAGRAAGEEQQCSEEREFHEEREFTTEDTVCTEEEDGRCSFLSAGRERGRPVGAMFKLHAVQAKWGDCLLVEYGAGRSQFLLVDGGFLSTYRGPLWKVLNARVVPAGGRLERVILSHVDADHIRGLLGLFEELNTPRRDGAPPFLSVGGLWHNPYGVTLDPEGSLERRLKRLAALPAMHNVAILEFLQSIEDGKELQRLAAELNIPRNGDGYDPLTVEMATGAVSFDNLRLTVVGPTEANLGMLRAEWEAWLDQYEAALLRGDLGMLDNTDGSPTNQSSICLVVEADGCRMLLTGDGRSDFLTEGLLARGFLDAAGRAHFDLCKLPHHGSNANITPEFFRAVTADRYVISANGTHGNPDYDTLVWLVEAAREQNREVEIICTNETNSTRTLVVSHPPDRNGYSIRILEPDADSIEVALA